MKTLTFWNRKESEQHDTIMMGTAYIIVDVANGHIDGPVFVLTSSDRHSSFITTQNDWNEHCTMHLRIFRDNVLV